MRACEEHRDFEEAVEKNADPEEKAALLFYITY